jgi:hypothetical protein
MTPTTVDITRKRGDTYADEIIVTSARTRAPLDITGCSFVLVLDPEPAPATSTSNVYSITGTVLDAAAGRVEFAPSEAQADRVGTFFYEVQMTDSAGRKRTITGGRYTYTQDLAK